ncbi:hypothetical protein E2C01_026790 [Portunus trituberculatus]|uniref:Uncharacterized protein n=1 Tax=Portunus trituberculatus TaxID=210409 RepID=A0A5B7EG88_PORTR|nr:hypothetical protein [Portunus trituberculatus]
MCSSLIKRNTLHQHHIFKAYSMMSQHISALLITLSAFLRALSIRFLTLRFLRAFASTTFLMKTETESITYLGEFLKAEKSISTSFHGASVSWDS